MFNELFHRVHLRAKAQREGDLEAEQRFIAQILSTLQQALESHLPAKWAEGRDGTIDGALPGTLQYDDPVLSFSGTAVWYDSAWYEDPLSIRIEFSPDGSGAVDAYAIRFGDADHGLRKFPYRNHSKHRHRPEPARWSYEFRRDLAAGASRLIRLACYEDLSAVQRLYKELRPQDPELAPDEAARLWRAVLDQPHIRLIVADQAGCLASTGMLAFVQNFASGGRPIGFIEHVVTLSEFRGQGLARAVLSHALELAWSQNCCKVVLLSGAQRGEAHRLYESLGFRGDTERGFVVKPEWVAASS